MEIVTYAYREDGHWATMEQWNREWLIHYWHFVADVNTRYYTNMEIVKYAYREEGEGVTMEQEKRIINRLIDYKSISDASLSTSTLGTTAIWRLWNTRTEKREWPTTEQGRRIISPLVTLHYRRQHTVLQQYGYCEIGVQITGRVTDDGTRKENI